MRIIFLVLLVASLADAKFVRSGDIIVDSSSSLEWQDSITPVEKSWEDAIDYCENLSLSSKNDWRLPNIKELFSIVDDSKSNPAINSSFINVISREYWSSSTTAFSSSNAWYIDFSDGDSSNTFIPKTRGLYVRCVRAGE